MSKPRDYREEYDKYQSSPSQIKARAARNKARRLMIKEHGKAAVKGKDVDHGNSNPTDNRPNNLSIMSAHKNRGAKRVADHKAGKN